METKTIVNGLEIVATQKVLIEDGEKVEVLIDDNTLKIVFEVGEKKEQGYLSYVVRMLEGTLHFSVYNIVDIPTTAIIKPIKVGVYDGKEMNISVFIEEIRQQSKDRALYLLTYQILLGKDVVIKEE